MTMTTNNSGQITGGASISSMTGISMGGSSIDVMSYVEMLLVKDYDAQMADMAKDIKVNTKLKEAYRNQKSKINDLLNKEQKDGKIELTAEEYNLLNSKTEFHFDPTMYDGVGGVASNNGSTQDIDAISNRGYADVSYKPNGQTIIASNQSAEWHGDPHFNDADSANVGYNHTDWDFQGVAGQTYNYLQDSNLSMTATHIAYGGGDKTVVGSANIVLNGKSGDSTIAFDAKSKPTFDGQTMQAGRTYKTADGGSAIFDGKSLNVKTAEGYTISLVDTGGYLNGQVKTGMAGVNSDGIASTGIIGSQFDADTNVNTNQENSQFAVGATTTQATDPNKTYKVDVDAIKAETERLQSKLDNLNSQTEMAQTELSTATNQRKLAFESMSTMMSKVFETTSTILRNYK